MPAHVIGARSPAAVREQRGHLAVPAWLALALFLSCLVTAPLTPLFDPDEGYYPATARESVVAGAGWDLRFNGEPRWDKPVLAYALIEAAFALLGPSTVAARLPSALEAAALLLIVTTLVARLRNQRAGLLAGLVLGSMLGIQIFGRVAHPEIAVVLSIVTTELLVCLWWVEEAAQRRLGLAALAGLSLGYGVLAKGPVAIVLPALMMMAAVPALGIPRHSPKRIARDLTVAGVVAFALAAPWYAAMTLRHGPAFLEQSLWQHNVVRYTTHTYGHGGGPLYFVVPVAAALFPWTALVPAAIGRVARRRDVLAVCMLASAATAFLFYSLSASKLANYALVIVPPMAILVGLEIDARLWTDGADRSRWRPITALLLGLIAVALIAGPFVAGRIWAPRELLGGTPSKDMEMASLARITLPAGLLLAAGAIGVATASTRRSLAALATVGILVPTVLIASVGPLLHGLYPWEAFGGRIASSPAPVALVGYRAPSLTFYAGQPIATEPVDQLAGIFGRREPQWVIVDRTAWTSAIDLGLTASTAVCAEGGRMVLVWAGGSECPRY